MQQNTSASTLVYMPSRLRMLLWLVGYIIFMAVLILIIVYLTSHPGLMHPVIFAIVLFGATGALVVVASMGTAILLRMFRLFPPLIVGVDGIVDNASCSAPQILDRRLRA
jgi:hypothetical protein